MAFISCFPSLSRDYPLLFIINIIDQRIHGFSLAHYLRK